MEKWIAYIYERFPPLIYSSLAFGIALSGSHIGGGIEFFSTVVIFVGLWLFFFCLRLSNDINDISKDRIAYPLRPLPSGKITLPEAKQLLLLVQLFLFAYSQIVWVFMQGLAALFFLCLACWAWLANKDFYLKNFLLRYRFIGTIIDPLYCLPSVFFAVSAGHPTKVFGVKAWALAVALYGAMLTFKLCRQLNPHIHPITASFIHYYGFLKTFYLAAFGLFLSGIAAAFLGVGGLLWPLQFIVMGTLVIQFYQREQFQLCNIAATVSLLVHAWAGVF